MLRQKPTTKGKASIKGAKRTTTRTIKRSSHHRRTTRYGDKGNNPHILNQPMNGQDFIYDPLVNKVC